MVQFDSTDLDNATSESGVVHESVANSDHDDASTLKQGYSLASPYKSSSAEVIYACQEDSGSTLHDYSGNNRDGTISGATVNATPNFLGTSSISGDGTDDVIDTGIDIGSLASTAGGLTLTGLIVWDDGGNTEECAFGQDAGSGNRVFKIEVNGFETGNPLEFRLYDGNDGTNQVFSSGVSTGTRYFFAGTWDGSTQEFYTDVSGSLQSEGTNSVASIGSSTANAGLLSNSGGGGQEFAGNVWMMRADSVAWTQSEVQAYYDVVNTAGTLTTQFKSV